MIKQFEPGCEHQAVRADCSFHPSTKFTDEDLKRFRNELDHTDQFPKMTALLARLEAAETCIDDHRGDCLEDVEKECSCGYSDKLKAWRRAKGELNDSEESKGE